MNSMTKQTQLTLLYIGIAFGFSVAMRMIWIFHFEDMQAFKYAGQFMINTNDGYYWAEGARDILSGVSQENDRSPITTAPSILTAFFVQILPFSFESIILYMPVVLGSLIVIPIILIAKALDNLDMGLIAALLASITWSYYNRTMVGYYDTDMLNIVLPMFLLWSLIWAVKTNEEKYLVFMALDILVYRWWYPQSYALEFAFFGLLLFYTLVWDRKNFYNYKLLSIMLLAMLNLDGFIRFTLLVASLYFFRQKNVEKYIYYIFGISIFLFFISGGLNPILGKLEAYIFSREALVGVDGLGLHFFAVMQTVREASHISFETFTNRISGSEVTFVVSLVGYGLLMNKHRIMLFSLPLVGLGFLASVAGLRFTIYAVPILAFGIAFLITQGSKYLTDKKSIQYFAYGVLSLAILFPNYKHIDNYKVPTVMYAQEVATLKTLESIAQRDDYVLAWWDYGYPIRYYADVKTLVDGGRHSGSTNFPVSFALTSPSTEAAKMARLDVEFTQKSYDIAKNNEALPLEEKIQYNSTIEEMTKLYGFNDTNDFLLSLATDIKLPEKTRDIYFYLPFKMLSIYPTVKVFSNRNLMTSESYKMPTFFITRALSQTDTTVLLEGNITFNTQEMSLISNGKKMTLNKFVQTGYIQGQKFHKNVMHLDASSKLNLIHMSAYNTFLLIDDATYNSLYIQLFVLEEYDKSLFEQVVINPHAKIYKLKI